MSLLILDARRKVEAILEDNEIKFDAFTQEAICWKLDYCFYRDMDASTAVDHVASQCVLLKCAV